MASEANRQDEGNWRKWSTTPELWEKRSQLTAAEAKLWELLRGRKFKGFKFRRQYSDEVRQELLESRGLRVIRFTNPEIFTAVEAVLERIASALQHTATPGSPSPNSERSRRVR